MFIILTILFIGTVLPVYAQNSDVETEHIVDDLLDRALDMASQNEWDKAFELLDEAESIAPENPKIAKYRKSILELQAVNTAQKSWETGKASEVNIESPDIDEGPKFVIERNKDDVRANPEEFRDIFRGQVMLKFLSKKSDAQEWITPWSSPKEFLYSAIGTDLRLWLPFLGRSLGFNVAYSGYSWKPGNPDSVYNLFDAGINLRGFIAEKQESRMEIGFDIGFSNRTMQSLVDSNFNSNPALYLGIWATDSLFFHLFNIEKLEKLVLGGKIRIYAPLDPGYRETVHYGIDLSWRFKNIYAGLALNWWDFFESSTLYNQPSTSLIFGTNFR